MSDHVTGAAHKEPTIPSRFELDYARLGRAVDASLIAAAGSAFWLVFAAGERGFPPFDAHFDEAIKRFGSPPNAALDLWRQCAALDGLSRVWTGKGLEIPDYTHVVAEVRRPRASSDAGTERAARSEVPPPTEEPVGPDEAVGLPAEKPDGDERQPRLGGR